MSDKFEIYSVGEFLDYLNSTATEWMLNAVTSFYDMDAVEDLSRDQIQAVFDYSESDACPDQAYPSLKDLISLWEDEHGELDSL